jgi:hypothetical protein
MPQRYKFKRMIAARICAVSVILLVLLSEVFLVKEADHDCTGADCPICAVMEQCSSNIRLLGAGAGIAAIILLPLMVSFEMEENHPVFLVFSSLVSQKIRMND